MLPDGPLGSAVFWSAATILLYMAARRLHRARPRWWLSPIVVAPPLLIGLALLLGTSYSTYIAGTGWLLAMLGPTVVAFAVPIYEQRALIRRHWPVLVPAVAVGSATAIASAWLLTGMLDLAQTLRLSLVPRSISTPFAMGMAEAVGGRADLAAVFVILTGIVGAAIGEAMLGRFRFGSAMARGALMGMGAHAVGTAAAHAMGREEGSIAGLVMILAGVANLLAAPLVAALLR